MRIGLAVDCGCDLPYDYFQQNHITILPGTVKFKDHEFIDDRKEAEALAIYKTGFSNLVNEEDAAAVTVEQIRATFLGKLITEFDYVFCLTTASARAPVYANATEAAAKILKEYRPVRTQAGIATPFSLRVLDSGSMGGGYAVLCAEMVNCIKAGDAPPTIRNRIEQLIPHIYTYYLIRDFGTVRTRLKEQGEKSIGWLQYMVAEAMDMKPLLVAHANKTGAVTALRGFERGARRCFEFISQRIRDGLLLPAVSIAYGGDLNELAAMPGYSEMLTVARHYHVTIYTSMMCISAAAYGSPGSLSFGFCASAHKFS